MDWEFSIFGSKDWLAVWNVQFHGREERRQTIPYSCKVESAHVSFCTTPGTIHVGQWGQLCSADADIYNVKVSYIDLADGHVVVSGDTTRTFYCDEQGGPVSAGS